LNKTVESILADALEWISENSPESAGEVRDRARAALDAAERFGQANQPVAKVFDAAASSGERAHQPQPSVVWIGSMPPIGTHLYAAPKAGQGLPPHWQALPRRPTSDMLMAGIRKGDTVNAYLNMSQAGDVFDAMCEAAPVSIRDDLPSMQSEHDLIVAKVCMFFQPERPVDVEKAHRCARAVQRAITARLSGGIAPAAVSGPVEVTKLCRRAGGCPDIWKCSSASVGDCGARGEPERSVTGAG
jgi:hypothetical protein